ncbi:hypothetical protein EON80_06630 [bacterium]|nr:MAG: hypothetical protein EON80_06630 [bacterium]
MLVLLLFVGSGLGLLVVGASVLGYLALLKPIIVRQRLMKLELRNGSPSGLAGLKDEELEAVTQQLVDLGFEPIEDYLSRSYSEFDEPALKSPIASPTGDTSLPPDRFPAQGFARVFSHPQHGLLGKIMFVSVVDAQGKVPTSTDMSMLIASFSEPDGAWVYVTTNRDSAPMVNALMKLLRHPRWLSTRLPRRPATELLQFHLKRRAEIATVGGFVWKAHPTSNDDHAYEERAVVNIRAIYAKLTPLKMAMKLSRLKKEEAQLEWLGELEGRMPSAQL